MSVLTLDERVYPAIANKIDNAGKRTVIDINYLHSCSHLQRTEISTLVNTWHRLNVETYEIRYSEKPTPLDTIEMIFDALPVNTYQFLKWLKCLNYNIEMENIEEVRAITPDEWAAHRVLDKIIENAMSTIIDSLPKYEAAAWGDYSPSGRSDISVKNSNIPFAKRIADISEESEQTIFSLLREKSSIQFFTNDDEASGNWDLASYEEYPDFPYSDDDGWTCRATIKEIRLLDGYYIELVGIAKGEAYPETVTVSLTELNPSDMAGLADYLVLNFK